MSFGSANQAVGWAALCHCDWHVGRRVCVALCHWDCWAGRRVGGAVRLGLVGSSGASTGSRGVGTGSTCSYG